MLPWTGTNVVLSTSTGETVHPLGDAFVNVEYSGSQYSLPLLIVREGSCGFLVEIGSLM